MIRYRLTLYDNDGVVLTPVDSAIHSDPFVVSTDEQPGSKAYITGIAPDAGRAVVPGSSWEIGRWGVSVCDVRVDEDNAIRWLTAFLGDEAGRLRLIGAKALVEEQLDAGDWVPVFSGRVLSVELESGMVYRIELTDDAERLKRRLFESVPAGDGSNSRVIQQTLIPLGWEGLTYVPDGETEVDFWTGQRIFSDRALSGKGHVRMRASIGQHPLINAGEVVLAPVAEELNRPDVKVTDDLLRFAGIQYRQITVGANPGGEGGIDVSVPITGNAARVVVHTLSGDLVGVYSLDAVNRHHPEETDRVRTLSLGPPPGGGVLVMGIQPNQEYNVRVFPPLDLPTGSNMPWILQADHPLDVLQDILEGQYDGLMGGAGSYAKIVYSEADLNSLRSLRPRIPFFALIDEPIEALDFIEKSLLAPYAYAYTFEPVMTPEGPATRLRVFDISLDTLSELGTISGVTHLREIKNEDVITEETFEWEPRKPISVRYEGKYMVLRSDMDSETVDSPHYFTDWSFTRVDAVNLANDVTEEFVVKGAGLVVPVWDDAQAVGNRVSSIRQMESLSLPYINRFGKHRVRMTIALRRGKYEDTKVGDWVLSEIHHQPSTSTSTRGDARLMQVVSKRINGPRLFLELIDSGVFGRLLAPIIESAGITDGTLNVVVSVPVYEKPTFRMDYALTDGEMPGHLSGDWTFAGTLTTLQGDFGGGVTFQIPNIPLGKAVFVRARTERVSRGAFGEWQAVYAIPSLWVTATAGSLPSLPAPMGLNVENVLRHSATVKWINAGAYQTEVWATNTEGAILQRFSVEVPGTKQMTLTNLDDSPTPGISVSIRHRDRFGNVSAFVSTSFNRGPGLNPAPSMAGLFIFVPEYFGDSNA